MAALKVYIAAPWDHKPDALAAQEKFEAAGFEVTSHWIKHHSDAQLNVKSYEIELQKQAIEDVNDVVQSDVFVILNLAKSEGKATEFGFAYGLGIPTILVGERTINIFYYLPNVFRADTVEKAISGILEAQLKTASDAPIILDTPETIQ